MTIPLKSPPRVAGGSPQFPIVGQSAAEMTGEQMRAKLDRIGDPAAGEGQSSDRCILYCELRVHVPHMSGT
jgi:hypothetical protein